jgi:hypothetical protein
VTTLFRITRSRALRAAAAVAAIAVTVPAGGAFAERIPTAACASGNADYLKGRPGGGSWQTFKAPRFGTLAGIGAAPQTVVSYAVAPNNPKVIAVTNGKAIHISRDGGCTFPESLRLDQLPTNIGVALSGQFTNILALHISTAGTVYATAEDFQNDATVGRPHVLINSNPAQNTWTLGDSGLPPVGHPIMLKSAKTSPGVLYLSFSQVKERVGGGTCPPAPLPCPTDQSQLKDSPGVLWGSTDGGKSWDARTNGSADLNGATAIRYYSIDDDDRGGDMLWAVGSGGRLRKSLDGGRSYQDPPGLKQDGFDFTAVESIDKSTRGWSVKLVAFSSDNQMIRLDAKGTWHTTRLYFGAVQSVAQRPDGDIAVATFAGAGAVQVWRIFEQDFQDYEDRSGLAGKKFTYSYGWEPVTPFPATGAEAHLSATSDGVTTFFMQDKAKIYRFAGSEARIPPFPAPPLNLVPPDQPLGLLSPRNLPLDIPVGQTRTVPYALTLPPSPTPVEVYLLIDNSGSMSPLIDDLKQSLRDVALSLNKSGVDIRMGVGQINVQPPDDKPPIDNTRTPQDESHPRPLYERLRGIGRIDPNLFLRLSTVDGNGGNGFEAQLESLWQSVAGDGLGNLGIPILLGYAIPPGQQAGFSADKNTIKVIVHATDEGFSTNIHNAHNDWREVADKLNTYGVKQIGLSQDNPDAGRDLRRMAAATGAVAPPGGTDCDADGSPDIRAGQPLVCGENYGLDKTLVNLLKALSDPQTIELIAKPTETLRSVSRDVFAINAKAPTAVTFKATFSCVGVAPGSYPSDLSAALRGYTIARAVATVNCLGPAGLPPNPPNPPGGVPENPPPVPQPQPVVAVPAPVQPIPQPQTQVQAQTNVNPQAGAADQEQEQHQLALAGNDVGIAEDDQLAMSSRPSASLPGSPRTVLGMGVAMAAGAGVALRRRTRTAYARSLVR